MRDIVTAGLWIVGMALVWLSHHEVIPVPINWTVPGFILMVIVRGLSDRRSAY